MNNLEKFIKSPYNTPFDYDKIEKQIRHHLACTLQQIIEMKKDGGASPQISFNQIVMFMAGVGVGMTALLPESTTPEEKRHFTELVDELEKRTSKILKELENKQ